MNLQQRLAAKRAGKLYGFKGGFRRVYPVHHCANGSLLVNTCYQPLGLREYKFSDEILGLRHAGWYRDSFQDSTYRGQVWRLPARDGTERFIAGYMDSDGGLAIIEPEAFDCERDAARRADHMAERDAQEEREYDERWQEASRANDGREEARDALRAARAEALRLVAALRAQRVEGAIVPALCDVLRAKVAECRERMRDALATIRAKAEQIEGLGMEGEF